MFFYIVLTKLNFMQIKVVQIWNTNLITGNPNKLVIPDYGSWPAIEVEYKAVFSYTVCTTIDTKVMAVVHIQ